ncbi:MAG: BON domain-containing protein [Rudaea sp.]|nr:BON domain-containing protein [Rudaea sp.]
MKMKAYARTIALLLAMPLLHGCFAVVVGGAAAGADAAHDRRSFHTVVDDRNIQLTTTDLINRDKELVRQDNRVKVVVYNGVMLLCGQVRSVELKQRAQTIAETVLGVKRLVNEVEVTDEPQGFWRRRQDNVLTARVKTGLLDITSMPGFDPTRVNVTSAHHVVYLMGVVSHEEADAVTDVARDMSGVEKVVKVFEYTD